MTLRTNARIAGATFLIYIGAGIASLRLASHPAATSVLGLATSFSALVLGVTLYALTRRQDPDIAMLGLGFRILEAAPGPGEIYFAAGSAAFCLLLARGRMIPVALAWLGFAASILLVILIPLQIAGFFGGPRGWSSPVTWIVWLPLLVFELAAGVWLLTRGVAIPESHAELG